MIQDVECIRTELETEPFRDFKLSSNRKIQLRQAESRDIIPPFSALPKCGGNHECFRIQALASAGSRV